MHADAVNDVDGMLLGAVLVVAVAGVVGVKGRAERRWREREREVGLCSKGGLSFYRRRLKRRRELPVLSHRPVRQARL